MREASECVFHMLKKTHERYYKTTNKQILFFKCVLCGERASWSYEAYTTRITLSEEEFESLISRVEEMERKILRQSERMQEFLLNTSE